MALCLLKAAERGELDTVRQELSSESVNYCMCGTHEIRYKPIKDMKTVTPLFAAAKNGHKDIVELLLAHEDIQVNNGSEIRVESDIDKVTLLYAAAENGHEDIVELLLAQKDILVNSGSDTGIKFGTPEAKITPLVAAAAEGRNDIVKILISRNDVILNAHDDRGRTPLTFAISRGDLDVLKLLLPRTSDGIYANTSRGEDAFEAAARQNKCYVIELLVLKEDIVLDLKRLGRSDDNQSVDVKKRKFDVVKPFLPNDSLNWTSWGTYDQPITASIMNVKDLNMIERLLERYSLDSSNRTTLSLAAENGYKALVRFLLINIGTSPNTKDDDGRTPLSRASENGHEVIVKLLLGKQAVDISKNEMEWASEEEKEIILTKNGADPNLEDNDGQTPLSWALRNGHKAILTLLVGLDTITLPRMVKEGNQKAIKSLIFAGSKIDERNSQGQTPLHAAIISGQLEVAKDLISYGAGINLEDNDNMTPLRLAVGRKDVTLIQELLKNKAEMKGVMADEWRYAYGKESVDVVQLSEAVNGEMQVDFTQILPTANQLSHLPLGMGRHLYSIIEDPDGLVWSKVPVTHANGRLKPNELYVSIFKATDDRTSDISLCLQLSIEHYLPDDNSIVSATNIYRIAWKMNRVTKQSSLWVSTIYFSTLPDGWIPQADMDLFRQFMFHVKESWLKLCQQFEKHLSSRRLKQLELKGKSPDMIDLLANDARKLAELRNILHNQIRSAERFIKDYCRYYTANKIPEGLLKDLADDFELIVNNWIGQLDQVVRDLLQIEFAWVSINETRISTRLGQNVMLLTYVSIFYLPLGFCAALWAIPDITDPNTRSPFIITSIVIGLVTLLVTFNMERISKMMQRAIQSAKSRIQSNITNKKDQNGDQNKANEQSTGFTDNITTFVMRLARKEDQNKQVSQAEVSNV